MQSLQGARVRELAFFQCPPCNGTRERIDEFISWASPSGTAGIDHIHVDAYVADAPYFEWSKAFFAHKDKTKRTYLWSWESLVLGAGPPLKTNERIDAESREGGRLIGASRFLRFAKSYLNVTAYYRNIRTRPAATLCAISFLEKSLRLLNNSDNDPANLNSRAFERAQILLIDSHFSDGQKYDTGRELEIMAGMLQHGYHSKSHRFAGKGFNILVQPFGFASRIAQRPRARHFQLNSTDLKHAPRERITSEKVAAVGLAYRKSLSMFGPLALPTFMAALAGLALTTVSMRVSDLLTLRRDAIYRESEESARLRIRLSRPKIGASQDLPLTKKLGDLASEMFGHLLANTEPAHKAFSFYIATFGPEFSAIDELYIPAEFRAVFSKSLISFSEVYAVMGLHPPQNGASYLPQRLRKFRQYSYIVVPGDIWHPHATSIYASTRFISIGEVESSCVLTSLRSDFPPALPRTLYVSVATAGTFIRGGNDNVVRRHLANLFRSGARPTKGIDPAELKAWMLDQFKRRSSFPHWPYVTKDKDTLLHQALFVHSATDIDPVPARGNAPSLWWMPTTVSAEFISRWISAAYNKAPPLLFKSVDITLKDGRYPSVTLHDMRRYHHTTALLAGAHEVFVDELAGRTSGRQSDHYDLRSPHEILASSIDTFDPESQFGVVGPIADIARKLEPADRQAFLYKNAAPKHVTEIGGCATDWSLDPCKQYGDCMRCDQHLWRKGDSQRLSQIQIRQKYAEAMIGVAEVKLSQYDSPPRSLLLQHQQFKDDLARCSAILDVESNPHIALGDIVTFSAPGRVTSAHELTARLAAEPIGAKNI